MGYTKRNIPLGRKYIFEKHFMEIFIHGIFEKVI